MSYLSVPRLHFFGQFLASPSTINNADGNYQTDPPSYPTYPPDVPPNVPGVLWNPMGVAKFMLNGKNVNGTALSGCTVQSVMPASGPLVTSGDPLVGASIQTSNSPAAAKIVDLDPDQQTATQFFGIQLQLVFADGTNGFTMKDGEFLEAPNLTDYSGSGAFESVVRPDQIDWQSNAASPLFEAFKAACQESGISVKFLINRYDTNSNSPTFNFGAIIGALGPATVSEPALNSVGRKFISAAPGFNSGYFQVDEARGKVAIDLSNSVPFSGKDADLSAAVTVGGQLQILGGSLDTSQQQYQLTAGIDEIDVTPAQISDLEDNPFSLVDENSDIVLSEWTGAGFPEGSYVTPERLSMRLSFGETGSIELIARKFGKPLANETFDIELVPGSASDGIQFPSSVTTGSDGRATISITASPPALQGDRADIGSQIYYLRASFQRTSALFWTVGRAFLTVKAYPEYTIPDNPTWDADVFPVMQQFMTLYPGMKKIHDMSNYTVASGLANALRGVFGKPITNPDYMPVTRELDPKKMEMVLKWIANGTPRN